MDPFTMMAIGQGAMGLIGGIAGTSQKAKGKKILDNLQEPDYNVADELYDNQRMAQNSANTGMPSQQYAMAQRNIERNKLAAIRSANTRRGALGAIAGIQQGADDASLNLDAANAQQRLANQQTLYGINNTISGAKDKKFNARMDSWQRKYDYGMGLLGMGNQNQMEGLDKGISGLLNLGMAGKGGGGASAGGSVGGF